MEEIYKYKITEICETQPPRDDESRFTATVGFVSPISKHSFAAFGKTIEEAKQHAIKNLKEWAEREEIRVEQAEE